MNVNSILISVKTYIQYIIKKASHPSPQKIWCFYPDPYKKGLAATGITGGVILSIIAIIFLLVAIVALFLSILAGALYVLAVVVLAAIAFSGGAGFKQSAGAGIVGLIITFSIAGSISEPVLGFVNGIWAMASEVGSNLQYLNDVYLFISTNILWIIGIILAPAISVSLVAGLFIAVIYSFIGIEKFVFKIYGIRNPCPVCSKGTEPANYKCPSCDEAHPVKLMPSQYGVFSHVCTNCSQKLPTLLLVGEKKKLPHSCPHCDTDLKAGVLGTDKHIAFIGGVGSGKTCLLLQATQQLLDQGAVIPEDDQERDFLSLQNMMERGEAPPKTQKKNIYRAFQLEIKKGTFPFHLHFYDIAGENFEDSSDAKAQKFFRTLDSIVFVFDPFYSKEFIAKTKITTNFQHTNQEPLEVLRNLIQALEKFSTNKKMIKKIAFNVVLVKTDTGYLNGVVYPGITAKERPGKIKQFILNELEGGAFIQLLEQYFKKINFHFASALGRSPVPENISPFTSDNLDFTLENVFKEVKMQV